MVITQPVIEFSDSQILGINPFSKQFWHCLSRRQKLLCSKQPDASLFLQSVLQSVISEQSQNLSTWPPQNFCFQYKTIFSKLSFYHFYTFDDYLAKMGYREIKTISVLTYATHFLSHACHSRCDKCVIFISCYINAIHLLSKHSNIGWL